MAPKEVEDAAAAADGNAVAAAAAAILGRGVAVACSAAAWVSTARQGSESSGPTPRYWTEPLLFGCSTSCRSRRLDILLKILYRREKDTYTHPHQLNKNYRFYDKYLA